MYFLTVSTFAVCRTSFTKGRTSLKWFASMSFSGTSVKMNDSVYPASDLENVSGSVYIFVVGPSSNETSWITPTSNESIRIFKFSKTVLLKVTTLLLLLGTSVNFLLSINIFYAAFLTSRTSTFISPAGRTYPSFHMLPTYRVTDVVFQL